MTNSIINFPFLVVDIETTGLSYKQNEIIEIGAIRFKVDGTTEKFSRFIKPVGDVPLFIYKLTGITEDQLKGADRAKVVLKDFYKFIRPEDVIVCHNAEFDIPFLNHHLSDKIKEHITNPILDTLVLSRIFTPFLKSHSLESMSQFIDVGAKNLSPTEDLSENTDTPSFHRAIYDAEMTGQLLYWLTDFITTYIKPEEINFLITVLEYTEKNAKLEMRNVKFNLQKSTDYLMTYLTLLRNYTIKFALVDKEKLESPFDFKHYNFIENKTNPSQTNVRANYDLPLQNIFANDGPFSRTFDHYELREGQIQMAQAVQNAFDNDQLLLVEAGTGVGKSLAYLVPALIFSQKTRKKVIISTNTKNLQEQLLFKDIPLMIKALDPDMTAVLLKGRDNYLCLRKWQELYEAFTLRQANITLLPTEAFGVLYLYLWAIHTSTGDINENPSFLNTPYQSALRKVSSDRHLCLGRKCHHFSKCFLMEVRQKAEEANILIINHSLLFADLQAELATLGNIDYLVFDEAHNLLSAAAEYLGFTLSYPDVNGFLNTIYGVKKDFQTGMMVTLKNSCLKSHIPSTDKDLLIKEIDSLLNKMDESKEIVENPFYTCGQIAKDKGSYNKLRVKTPTQNTPQVSLNTLKDYLHDIAVSLRKLKNSIMVYEASKFDSQDTILDFLEKSTERLNDFIKKCEYLAEPDFDKYAYWFSTMEIRADNYPDGIYNYAPIIVSDTLPDVLYSKVKSLVFTSATMSLRGSFKYFVNNMGLEELKGQTSEIREQGVDDSQLSTINYQLSTMVVPSPFDYDTQTVVINTSYLPAYTDPYFAIQSVGIIKAIIERKPVGTLVLFTSYKDLKVVYESLEQTCFEKNILLLAQGISGSRSSILNRFKEDGKAILLGTSSFWEGIDVLGDSLSLLVMYKLPFAVPSEPIVEAYLEKLEKEGKNSFMHYSVPNALLKVRQGIGRLIRSKTDKGAILILDNRITTKTYGQYFREIIPTRIHSTSNPVETIDFIFGIL